jgi:hypothetical protein
MRYPSIFAMQGSTILCAALLLGSCKEGSVESELNRDECVRMVVRVNQLKNQELGRANDVERRGDVDSCMTHGTRAQLECVEFARNGGEVERCSDLAR